MQYFVNYFIKKLGIKKQSIYFPSNYLNKVFTRKYINPRLKNTTCFSAQMLIG